MLRYKTASMSVVRALAIDAGMKVKGLVATTSCRNPNCVRPEHVVLVPRGTLNRLVTDEQQYQKRPAYRIAVSKSSAHRKLTDEQVAEIRACAGGDTLALSQTYGVTRSHINSIIKGHRRAMMATNVFAGLM